MEALRGKTDVEVYCDGGVRYGEDIFKLIAMGAKFVFLGRPVLWANACDGQKGIEAMFAILKEELRKAMALSGVNDVKKLDQSYVINPFKSNYKL